MITDKPVPAVDQELDDALDRRADDLLALCRQLIMIDSQIPPVANEVAVIDFLRGTLADLGLPRGDVISERPERPNLVATVPGSANGPRLMLCGHVDTKPVGDAGHLWRTDPLGAEIVDGQLYGLGASDMKSACAAMIFALHAVREVTGGPAGDVTLALVADEEAGARHGARFLAPLIADRADACLIGEPSGWEHDFQALHLVSRGLLCFRVDVTGTQMHSSLSDRMPSINANVKLARLLADLADFDGISYRPHPLGDLRPTLNVGTRVEGGVYYGVVPGSARFTCDLRALPGMTEQSVLADLNRWLAERRAADPDLDAVITVEPDLPWIPPSEIAVDHGLVTALRQAAAGVLGEEPPLGVFPGATDAPWFDLAGLPTVPSFGPGILTCCHGPNERVSVPAILQAAKVYARTIHHFARPASA